MLDPVTEHVGLLDWLRMHDANEEIRYIHDAWISVAWSWLWLDWTFGVAIYLDEKPGVWLNIGPLTVGAFHD